jgi:hypothetical protein
VSRGGRVLLVGDVVAAVALVALLVYCVLDNDAPQLHDKAMQVREFTYPIGILLAPLGYAIARRGRRRRGVSLLGGVDARSGRELPRLAYPHLVGILLTVPLVVDLVGNVRNYYDSVEHFDDWVHFANPVLIMVGGVLVLGNLGVPRWTVAVMSFSIGCTLSMFWELIEGGVLERIAGVRLGLTEADTVSDMANGVVGALLGTVLGLALLHGYARRAPDFAPDADVDEPEPVTPLP